MNLSYNPLITGFFQLGCMIKEAGLLEIGTELETSVGSSLLNDTLFEFSCEKLLSNHVLSNFWCGVEAAIFNTVFQINQSVCVESRNEVLSMHFLHHPPSFYFFFYVKIQQGFFCILACLSEEEKKSHQILEKSSPILSCAWKMGQNDKTSILPLLKFLYSLPSNHILLYSYKSSDYPREREFVGFCMYLWPPYPNQFCHRNGTLVINPEGVPTLTLDNSIYVQFCKYFQRGGEEILIC